MDAKLLSLLIASLCMIGQGAGAQSNGSSPLNTNKSSGALESGLTIGVNSLALGLSALASPESAQALIYPLPFYMASLGSTGLLYGSNWALGLGVQGVQAVGYWGAAALNGAGVPEPLASLSFTLSYDLGLVAGYMAYNHSRTGRLLPDHSLGELLSAPFQPKLWASPWVWTAFAGSLVYNLLSTPADNSMWATGQGYYGGANLGPAGAALAAIGTSVVQNLAIAVGEETHYRGMAHRSMEQSMTPLAASVVSIAYFAGSHSASLIAAGAPPEVILGKVAEATLSGILWTAAYRDGGLPTAIASHFWFNTVTGITQALLTGGIPH